MPIIDAQIHVFGADGAARAARIGQRVLEPTEIVAELDAAGVDGACLVPAGSGANDVCLDVARRWPDRFRVFGLPKLDQEHGEEQVGHWLETGFTGARVTFPPFRQPSWLQDGTADWFWPVAEAHGIPLMIWAPEQEAAVADIARAHPRLRLALDHLNLYVEDKGRRAVTEVVDRVLPLAELPNVAVKASALPAHSTEPFPYADLHDPLRSVVAAFGVDRVFWGTDFTRLPCGLPDAVAMFTEHLDFLDPHGVDRVMGGALMDWIGW